MMKEEYIRVIEKNTELFVQEITRSKNVPDYIKSIRIEQSEFPLFHPGSKAFFEYRSLEWNLESSIRDYLVTNTICDLLNLKGITTLLPQFQYIRARLRWRDETRDYEETIPFSFVMETPERIGVRYTDFNLNDKEIVKTLKEYHVDKVIILRWNEENQEPLKYEATRTVFMHVQEYFEQYLSKDIYTVYLAQVREAVQKANRILEFEAIPQMYSQNQSSYRLSLIDRIEKTKFRDEVYFPGDNRTVSSRRLSQEQFDLLDMRFFDEKLYQALGGSEDFAKSIITSEYFFHAIQKGQQLDYSTVIIGYIKAVEQLLYKFYMNAFGDDNSMSIWSNCNEKEYQKHQDDSEKYRINPYKQKEYQKKKEQKNWYSIELGGLIYFVRYRDDLWALDEQGKEVVCSYLEDYCKSCRNGYFHKEIISDYKEVLRIRNNTFLCLYYILGGFKLSHEIDNVKEFFGVTDYSFERFCEVIRNTGEATYCFEMQDGREYLFVRSRNDNLHKQTDELSFSFIKVRDRDALFNCQNETDLLKKEGSERIEINRENLPKRAWIMFGSKKNEELIW